MDTEIFNLERVYDERIGPLMKKIIEICKEVEMPMLASFCYKKDEDEFHGYCTTSLTRKEFFPDELMEALRIIKNGASTRPKVMAITITKEGK